MKRRYQASVVLDSIPARDGKQAEASDPGGTGDQQNHLKSFKRHKNST